jgi:hypothetical protein
MRQRSSLEFGFLPETFARTASFPARAYLLEAFMRRAFMRLNTVKY